MKTNPVKESDLSQVTWWVAVALELGLTSVCSFLTGSHSLSGSNSGMLEELSSVKLGHILPHSLKLLALSTLPILRNHFLSPRCTTWSPCLFLFLASGMPGLVAWKKLPFVVCCPHIVHFLEVPPSHDLSWFFFLWRPWCQCSLQMTGTSWRTPWKSPKNSGWWSITCIEMLSSR